MFKDVYDSLSLLLRVCLLILFEDALWLVQALDKFCKIKEGVAMGAGRIIFRGCTR